jgi:hypothetical protein
MKKILFTLLFLVGATFMLSVIDCWTGAMPSLGSTVADIHFQNGTLQYIVHQVVTTLTGLGIGWSVYHWD